MKKTIPLVEIVSTGRFLPPGVTTNADLEAIVDTSDEWITTRTGIKERRLAGNEISAAQMGAKAGLDALDKCDLNPSDIDLLIVSTATPDRLLPSMACDVQALIGATNAVAFDVGGPKGCGKGVTSDVSFKALKGSAEL